MSSKIDARSEWPAGTAWRWIDKSMGVRRRETVFDHRVLAVAADRATLIAQGAADRSAAVRRAALTGAIRHLAGTAEARMIAEPLVADRSASLRERAEFISRVEAD